MKNKFFNIVLLSLLIFPCQLSIGQIAVYNNQSCAEGSKLEQKDYDRLKASTIYFVAPGNLIEDKEEFAEILKKNWKFSNIELIEEKDIEKHIEEENAAFFSMGYLLLNNVFNEVYYELWQLKDPSKHVKEINLINLKRTNKMSFAKFTLDLTCEVRYKIAKAKNREIDELLMKNNKISNFKPGIIATYLKLIDDYLTNKDKICQPEIKKNEELNDLSEDTLYITNSFLQFVNFNNDGCYKKKLTENEVIGDYPYAYKFITLDELNVKLLANEKFYYLLYLPTVYYFTVYHSKGDCVFNTILVGTKRSKYMEKLSKLISK